MEVWSNLAGLELIFFFRGGGQFFAGKISALKENTFYDIPCKSIYNLLMHWIPKIEDGTIGIHVD